MPEISVVMPVYNCEAFIRESVESILTQSFTDFEFFIIDDASTDRTVEIIKEYTDARINLIIKPKNTGYTDSLNMAIKLAKGEYIARMDADDISMPQRLAVQYEYLKKNNDILVLGSHYKIIGSGVEVRLPVTSEEAKLVALMHVPVAHPTVMMPKKLFTEHELYYDKNFEPAEDYDLWCKVLQIGKIENIDEVLLQYRHHSQQESKVKYEKILKVDVETRLSQLEKLISFSGKSYDILFTIDVMTKVLFYVNKPTLKKIRSLLNDLYEANKMKSIYNQQLFFKYLRERWIYYINQYEFCHICDISFLFSPNNYGVTKINNGFRKQKLASIFRVQLLKTVQ